MFSKLGAGFSTLGRLGGARSAAAVMPAGALGIWYADQYAATPRPTIPNSVSTASISANIGGPPRNAFVTLWGGGAFITTLTDHAATGPDGLTSATILTTTAANWSLQWNTGSLPSSVYTVAANVRSHSGSNEIFGIKFGPQSSANKTATTSWQRFSFTTTLISGVNGYGLLNAGVGANIEICDVEVFAGSADLGPTTLGGHMIMDYGSVSAPVSGGIIDLTGGSNRAGVFQFPAKSTYSAFTVIGVGLKASAIGGMQEIIGGTGNFVFETVVENNQVPDLWINSFNGFTDPIAETSSQKFFGPITNAWQVYSSVYDGTTGRVGINELVTNSGPFTSLTFSESLFYAGNRGFGGSTGYKWHAFAFYSRALSKDEIAQAVAALKARALSRSALTVAGGNRYYAAEGDSLSYGFAATTLQGWTALYSATASPYTYGFVYARNGAALTQFGPGAVNNNLESRAAALDAHLPSAANRVGKKFILSVMIGANDLTAPGFAGGTPADYAARLATYLDARRTAGWLVALCTLTPQTAVVNATFNTARATFNTIVRGWGSGLHYDALIDFAADATMGPDAAAANTALYGDGEHPTDAGYANLKAIAAPILNAM